MYICQSQHEHKGGKNVNLGLQRRKSKVKFGVWIPKQSSIHRRVSSQDPIYKRGNQNFEKKKFPLFSNSKVSQLIYLAHHKPYSHFLIFFYFYGYCSFSTCIHAWICDPPNTVTVARAVRTGMVNSEQVYSPSSDSCTSAMVMESSVGVERCSWIRLSLKAGETNKISIVRQVFSEMLLDIFTRDTVLKHCYTCVLWSLVKYRN